MVFSSSDSVKSLFAVKFFTLYVVGELVEIGDEQTSQIKQMLAGRFLVDFQAVAVIPRNLPGLILG